MRNTPAALYWALLAALLASSGCGSAQNTTDDQEPTAKQSVAQKRAQTLRDDSEFRALHNPVISADGAWMAAEERPDRGDGNVRVWSTKGDVSFTIERGLNPLISRDSRWVSALQKPPLEDSRTAKPKNQRAGQTLVLLDTQNGSRRTFDFVLSYDMTYASTYLLYLQSPETKADEEGPSKDEATKPATKPATKKRKMGTLHQIPLHPARLARNGHQRPYATYSTKNVVEFATYPTSHQFAYVLHDEETGCDTLRICKWGIRAFYYAEKGEKIEGLCWGRDPRYGDTDDPRGRASGHGGSDYITLGFLVHTETTGKDGKRRMNSALYTWHPAQSSKEKFTRVRDDSLHNLVISADGGWMAAEERPDRGDGNVRVWSTERDVTFSIERGQNPRISHDSRWVSALLKPQLEKTKTDEPKNKRAGQTLVLLDTQDGSRRTFDFVLSYDMTCSSRTRSSYLVYLQSPEAKADEEGDSRDEATKPATKPAARERTGGTLHVVHLKSGNVVIKIENVAQYATHQTANRVAFMVRKNLLHDEETGRDTLHIAGFSQRNWGINAIFDGEKIEGLCWARDRITLGFLDSRETTGKDGKRRVNSALYTWQRGQSWDEKFTRVDTPK
jgi:hypothetical protein